MLGFLATGFAWGAAKAVISGRKGKHFAAEFPAYGLGELSEELEFRVGVERLVGRQMLGMRPVTAQLGSAVLFGLTHPGNEVDAALGGLFYSHVYEKHGLAGSVLAHLCHNLGVWAASK